MAADEQQPQHVVAVVRIVQPLDHVGLAVVQVGQLVLVRKFRLLGGAPHLVDTEIAPDENQPGDGVARWPLFGPTLQGAQAGFLESFLGPVEIAEIAQQRRHCLRPGGGQRGVDPGRIAHATCFWAAK